VFQIYHNHHLHKLGQTLEKRTRGVQKVLQIDIQKIHKALEFDLI